MISKNFNNIVRKLTSIGYDFISENYYKQSKKHVLVFENPKKLHENIEAIIGNKYKYQNIENKTIFITRK